MASLNMKNKSKEIVVLLFLLAIPLGIFISGFMDGFSSAIDRSEKTKKNSTKRERTREYTRQLIEELYQEMPNHASRRKKQPLIPKKPDVHIPQTEYQYVKKVILGEVCEILSPKNLRLNVGQISKDSQKVAKYLANQNTLASKSALFHNSSNPNAWIKVVVKTEVGDLSEMHLALKHHKELDIPITEFSPFCESVVGELARINSTANYSKLNMSVTKPKIKQTSYGRIGEFNSLNILYTSKITKDNIRVNLESNLHIVFTKRKLFIISTSYPEQYKELLKSDLREIFTNMKLYTIQSYESQVHSVEEPVKKETKINVIQNAEVDPNFGFTTDKPYKVEESRTPMQFGAPMSSMYQGNPNAPFYKGETMENFVKRVERDNLELSPMNRKLYEDYKKNMELPQ